MRKTVTLQEDRSLSSQTQSNIIDNLQIIMSKKLAQCDTWLMLDLEYSDM